MGKKSANYHRSYILRGGAFNNQGGDFGEIRRLPKKIVKWSGWRRQVYILHQESIEYSPEDKTVFAKYYYRGWI